MAAGSPPQVSLFARLSILGAVLVLVAIGLFLLRATRMVEHPVDNDLLIIGGLGAALVALAHLGPLVESVKAGKDGVEFTFGSQVNAQVLELTEKLGKLQTQVDECCARPAAATSGRGAGSRRAAPSPKADEPKPPYRDRRIVNPEDKNKGRFGGKSEDQGFTLGASFNGVKGKDWVTVQLFVTAGAAAELQPGESVQFYLHETFPKRVVRAPFQDGRAEIEFWSWGGFTAGAWIPSRGIELELDLSQLDGAPQIVRDR